MAGTAREEAERLVATVLAMANQNKPSSSGTAKRVTDGLGALGETLAGVVGQLTGASSPGDSGTATGTPGSAGSDPSGSNASGSNASGSNAGGSGSGGSNVGGSGTGGSNVGGHRGGAWATGSPECCVCPLCKAIAGMREPGPHTVERLATGAGDLAVSVASMMRAVSVITGNPRPKPSRPARPAPPTPDQAWSTATHVPESTDRADVSPVHVPESTDRADVSPVHVPESTDRADVSPTQSPAVDSPATEPPAAGSGAAGSSSAGRGTGRPEARPPVTPPIAPPVGSDPWSAASSADAAATALDQRAKAARKAADAQAARLAARAEAARLAEQVEAARVAAREAARRVAEARAEAVRNAASRESDADGTGDGRQSRDPEPLVGRGDPRIESGFLGLKGERPAKGDVWAAATTESGMAPQRNVDHDVPDPAADADRPGGGSEAAGDA